MHWVPKNFLPELPYQTEQQLSYYHSLTISLYNTVFKCFVLLRSDKIYPYPWTHQLPTLFGLGVSTGRVCSQPANRPVRDRVAYSQPATDPLRGSGFAGRFSGRCHRFRVRPKLDGKHRKMAKIGDISPDPAKIRWGFRQIRLFFLQIVSRISGSGVSMPDLIILVAEICQIKLKTRRNQWKIRQNWCLRAGRVSRVLNEGTRNRPAGVGFWNSGPVADRWSSRIGWTPVGYGRVGRVGWTALLKATLQSKNVLTDVFLPTVKLEV